MADEKKVVFVFSCLLGGQLPTVFWSKHIAAVCTAAWQLRWHYIWFSNRRATAAVYMLTMWGYVQTAAWPQPELQPELQPDLQPDRSSLYINNQKFISLDHKCTYTHFSMISTVLLFAVSAIHICSLLWHSPFLTYIAKCLYTLDCGWEIFSLTQYMFYPER